MAEQHKQLQALILWGIVALCAGYVTLWFLGVRIPSRRAAADSRIAVEEADDEGGPPPRPIELPDVEPTVIALPTDGPPEQLLR